MRHVHFFCFWLVVAYPATVTPASYQGTPLLTTEEKRRDCHGGGNFEKEAASFVESFRFVRAHVVDFSV